MLVTPIRTAVIRGSRPQPRVVQNQFGLQQLRETSTIPLVDSLSILFEKMKIVDKISPHRKTSRYFKPFVQRRTYTVQYRRYTSFKPQEKMDNDHVDEDGKIKDIILAQRKKFLKDNDLLKDCFTYYDRIVYANKHLYDLHQKDTIGRSNLERMRNGYCPVDKSGQDIIIIHHFDQTMQGPWVILTQSFHQNESRNLHSFVILKDRVNRHKFNIERQQYWKYIAKEYDSNPQSKESMDKITQMLKHVSKL